MPDRTCPSCGADVGGARAFCPRCGADLDASLIQLGAERPPSRAPVRRPTAPGRRSARSVLAYAAVAGLVALGAGTLLGDDDGEDVSDGGTTTSAPGATTTSLDLRDRAPLLGEETGLSVALLGQSNVVIDLDDGSVEFFNPFRPVAARGDDLITVGDLGVARWSPPYDGREFEALDEVASADAFAGGSVVWSLDRSETRVRALQVEPAGLLLDHALPSGSEVVGAIGDALVVGAPGGTFVLEVDGSSRAVVTGRPLAVAGDVIVVSACSDDLACEVQTVRLDGSVEQRLPLVGPAPIRAAAASTDGRVAWIAGDPGEGSVFVDGRSAFPVPATGALTLDWSPDGRWLVGSFGRRNVWFLDGDAGPGAEPLVVELGQNAYPVEVFFVPG